MVHATADCAAPKAVSYPIVSYPILSYPIALEQAVRAMADSAFPIVSNPILSYPILSYRPRADGARDGRRHRSYRVVPLS